MTTPTPAYAVFSSGGKDSLLALDRATRQGLPVTALATLYDAASQRVRFHGVPVAVMRAQAAALGWPIHLYPTTPTTFEAVLQTALVELRAVGITGIIFGNIHLADVRAWYEERVRAAGLEHVEPLWGGDPAALARESLQRGFRALLTCVETTTADPAWLGQPFSEDIIAACVARGCDPCGEHGEYHTLVVAGPLLRHPLPIALGAIRQEDRFAQIDVTLADPTLAKG